MKESNKPSDIVFTAKARFARAKEATENGYREMVSDLHFLNGNQWDDDIKADRQSDGRPILTINKLPTFIDQIVGDQRMNRPGIKIKPVDSGGDRDTAEVIQGLIKNIEVQSDATIAYDTAFDGAVSCGFGCWRITSEYVDDEGFDQELRIVPIMNQFSVYYDSDAQKWNKEDANWWFITEKMSKQAFEAEYPKADTSSFDADRDLDLDWGSADQVRVAEYYWKEYTKKKLMLFEHMTTGEQLAITNKLELVAPEEWILLKERDVDKFQIKWVRMTGHEVIEGPVDIPGKFIPIVPVFGKNINIENQINYRGAVRNAKDPQRLYNYNRSQSAEVLSLAPKAPYLLTPKQVQGYTKSWEASNRKNYTYLLYNPDPMAKGVPQRQPANPISSGIQQEVMISDQELHDTTGLQRSSLGKQGNEKSGKAIMARQKEGDVGSFQYTDNLMRAMTHCGRILIDLIPIYYDTERTIRILKEDGTDRSVTINQQEGDGPIYDMSVGRYDVVVTVGPSFTTQRQEAATSMMEFLQYVPDAGPLIADLVAKNMDWPGADQIEKRLQKMLPPGMLEGEDGQPQPPPEPQGPTPEEKALAETMMELEVKLKEAELNNETAKIKKIEAEIEKIEAETFEKEHGIAQSIRNESVQ